MRRRHRRVAVPRLQHPERRAQRGRRPSARGIRDGPDQLRRAPPRHLRRSERVLDMSANGVLGSLNFPSLPGFAGRLFAAARRQGRRARVVPRLQRLAHRRVVRLAPERFIPLAIPPIWDPAGARRRGAPRRRRRTVTRSRSPRIRCRSGCRACTRITGTRSGRRATTKAPSCACTSVRRRSSSITAPDAPVDVLITLQPMNLVQAAADLVFSPVFGKFPNVTVALVRGRHRLGPVLPRTARPFVSWRTRRGRTPNFGDQLPSQVFMERVILCFIEDDFGARHAREIGTTASASKPTTRTAMRYGRTRPNA